MSKKNTINAIISGIGILIGRISGLIREILFAYLFGTSPLIGLFKYAFTLPNLARRIFGEGALSNAFIPLLADIQKKNKLQANIFSSKVLSLFTLINILLTGLGITTLMICSQLGVIPEENQALVTLGSIMFPYLPFICLCGMLSSILNLHNSFKLPSLMSSAMNFCLIIASSYAILNNMLPEDSVILLAWTLLFSGLLQVIILLIASRKKLKLRFYATSPKDTDLKFFWLSFLPVLVGASAQQISTALDKTIALWIGPHTVAALSYSELLVYLPVGVIGVALGSVCLPSLSKSLAKGDQNEVEDSFSTALNQVFFLSVPCSCFFFLFGPEILKCIFLRGAFDQQSLNDTMQAFIWFLPGIPFFAALKVVLPLFYANKNTKTPLKISLWMICLNLIIGITFIPLLQHGSLAMASSISATLNFAFLLTKAVKLKYISNFYLSKIFIKIAITAGLATSITYFSKNFICLFNDDVSNLSQYLNLSVKIAYFSIIYVLVSKILNLIKPNKI